MKNIFILLIVLSMLVLSFNILVFAEDAPGKVLGQNIAEATQTVDDFGQIVATDAEDDGEEMGQLIASFANGTWSLFAE